MNAVSYIAIPAGRLLVVALFIVVALAISRRFRLGLESTLAVGALRGAVQLLAVGYVLQWIIGAHQAWTVCLALAAMTLVAGWTASHRIASAPASRAHLFGVASLCVAAGSVLALVPAFAFVLMPNPWYDPRYVIPISGMVLSNAMNTVALVFDRIFSSVRAEADSVQVLLALGARPEQAVMRQMRAALRGAMIPTINGLLTVGLVALPGMMTGQVISGVPPTNAVRYQLLILYQLVAVAAVSGACAAWAARRMLFTPLAQLRMRI